MREWQEVGPPFRKVEAGEVELHSWLSDLDPQVCIPREASEGVAVVSRAVPGCVAGSP